MDARRWRQRGEAVEQLQRRQEQRSVAADDGKRVSERMDDKVGSIKVRKLADLIVLDRNLFAIAVRVGDSINDVAAARAAGCPVPVLPHGCNDG